MELVDEFGRQAQLSQCFSVFLPQSLQSPALAGSLKTIVGESAAKLLDRCFIVEAATKVIERNVFNVRLNPCFGDDSRGKRCPRGCRCRFVKTKDLYCGALRIVGSERQLNRPWNTGENQWSVEDHAANRVRTMPKILMRRRNRHFHVTRCRKEHLAVDQVMVQMLQRVCT